MISRDIKETRKLIQPYIRNKSVILSVLIMLSVLKPGGVRVQEQSCKLKVGDIIELTPAQRVPADLVLLHST